MDEISASVLNKLPVGRFVKTDIVKDMDGIDREAIIWYSVVSMYHGGSSNKSFDIHTGEYLGEY